MDAPSLRSSLLTLAAVGLLFTGCVDDPDTSLVAPQAPSFNVTAAGEPTTGNHLVLFNSNAVPRNFATQIEALGGRIERTLEPLGIAVVSGLDDAAADALARAKGVRFVEPDLIMPLEEVEAEDVIEFADDAPTAGDPTNASFFPRQWHHRAIQADVAWAAGYLGSPDVVVSIIDSGLDYNHASLEGRVDLSRSISLHPQDDEELATYFPGAHPIADLGRHGTHVGATVVSTGEVGAGVTVYTTLIGVKVCGWNSGCPRSAVLEAILYSADQGADIINMSLGGTFLRSQDRGGWLPLILRATNYAHSKGSLIVVSAGNDALDLDHAQDLFKTYCSASNVVCVAGTGPTTRGSVDGPWDDFDQPYVSSNYGRSVIDVSAPSGNTNNFVYAACSSFSLNNPGCQESNRFIIGLRGTSMAAPHVSGVAALIAAHTENARGNPALIRARLHQTADKITGAGNDPHFGKGRINAARAVGLY